MGKSKSTSADVFAVSRKAVDPALDQLFSSSFGAVKAPPKSRYEAAPPVPSKTADDEHEDDEEEQEGDDEELSELDSDEEVDAMDIEVPSDLEPEDESEEADEKESKPAKSETQPRKRRRGDDGDDLEDKYMTKLAKEEEKHKQSAKAERDSKRQKVAPLGSDSEDSEEESEDDGESENGSGSEDGKESGDGKPTKTSSDKSKGVPMPDDVPQHESLAKSSEALELEKSARTVFLGNVSTLAITDKKAKKTLMDHMSSIFDAEDQASSKPKQKIESIRFRSTAFSAGSIPKKAAYIKQELMDATTKSTNAYLVYSSPALAREAVKKLNGTVVLSRHLRVDGVAHPAKTDHRRCVFVGNLGFVDDESMLSQDGEKKKRNKAPADVEEGLWREFGKVGKVESVRVVRDSKTRVGKGFAYVQFEDANAVEAALLLNEKKFPPMLPRALRVTRAKAVKKTASHVAQTRAPKPVAGKPTNGVYNPKVSSQEQSLQGRAAKLFGKAGAAKMKRQDHQRGPRSDAKPSPATGLEGIAKTPEAIIFEGMRASEKAGRPRDLKFGNKSKGAKAAKAAKGGKKPASSRASKRAAEWKKSGGRAKKD